jgi:hypothetical protein
MTINCDQCIRIISRQLDRATSDKETQAVRTHALQCENCRARFTAITGADRLLGKILLSQRLPDGFSGTVAERLAEAHLAETVTGISKTITTIAVALGILVIVLFIAILARTGPEIPIIGELGRIEGQVEIALFKSTSFSTASMGEEIPQGARVHTRVGSGLLKLARGRDVALGAQTHLNLAHYHDGTKVLLERGEIYVLTPEEDMQVDTTGAKVYGRKAAFLVRYESSGKTTVVVESGEVSLFGPSGAVTVLEGEKAELLEGDKPRDPAEVNLKNYLGWVRELGL